jgi:hypothetical protein
MVAERPGRSALGRWAAVCAEASSLIVVPFNRFSAKMTAPPTPSESLLCEIRDLLESRA